MDLPCNIKTICHPSYCLYIYALITFSSRTHRFDTMTVCKTLNIFFVLALSIPFYVISFSFWSIKKERPLYIWKQFQFKHPILLSMKCFYSHTYVMACLQSQVSKAFLSYMLSPVKYLHIK